MVREGPFLLTSPSLPCSGVPRLAPQDRDTPDPHFSDSRQDTPGCQGRRKEFQNKCTDVLFS